MPTLDDLQKRSQKSLLELYDLSSPPTKKVFLFNYDPQQITRQVTDKLVARYALLGVPFSVMNWHSRASTTSVASVFESRPKMDTKLNYLYESRDTPPEKALEQLRSFRAMNEDHILVVAALAPLKDRHNDRLPEKDVLQIADVMFHVQVEGWQGWGPEFVTSTQFAQEKGNLALLKKPHPKELDGCKLCTPARFVRRSEFLSHINSKHLNDEFIVSVEKYASYYTESKARMNLLLEGIKPRSRKGVCDGVYPPHIHDLQLAHLQRELESMLKRADCHPDITGDALHLLNPKKINLQVLDTEARFGCSHDEERVKVAARDARLLEVRIALVLIIELYIKKRTRDRAGQHLMEATLHCRRHNTMFIAN